MKIFKLRKEDAIKQKASNGWLMKWDLGDFWVKSPGIVNDTILWDSYSEALAYSIALDLGISRHLCYEICIIELNNSIRIAGCLSRNFIPNGYKEVTFQKLIELGYINNNSGYTEIIREIKKKFGINIQGYIEDTLILDSVILNSDRHLWNMSLLYNRNDMIEAPIYDSGSSLGLYTYRSGQFSEELLYLQIVSGANPFDYYFENQIKNVRNIRTYKYELINFNKLMSKIKNEFTISNNKYNIINVIDNGQIEYIESLVNTRINTIIRSRAWKN